MATTKLSGTVNALRASWLRAEPAMMNQGMAASSASSVGSSSSAETPASWSRGFFMMYFYGIFFRAATHVRKEPSDTRFYPLRSSSSTRSPGFRNEAANACGPVSMLFSGLAQGILLTPLCAVTHSAAYLQNETPDAFSESGKRRAHTTSFS
ncbi:hypothetical protein VOI32_20345 [Paraburkholderia caribensis]|uniref:Uncharacterized protein n=1 Tax=Paraburkholderia caribensis TaxID=75105 RepID=A0ABV0DYP5_9BURK|nr:hypothetical protein [Paraburkholderia caribensis]MCO4879482.1 hypothetical protein [Paraburkholderia caribensis]